MEPLLKVEHLKTYFEVPTGTLHAVDDLSFEVYKGKTLGIVGESGCGKSTLGRTIIHLLQPTSGKILFEGRDITFLKKRGIRELFRDIQFIFQDPFSSLNPRMTTKQLIMEPLIIDGMRRADAQREALKLMDTVGMASRFADSYPHELDGGRRQRIVVARALALKPKMVICDEPVSALDVSIQAQILNLLEELQEEFQLAYLFITHDMSVVRHISDDILVMYLGQMMEYAPTESLFQEPRHPYTRALLSAVPTVDVDAQKERIILSGEISSPINPKPGCRFAARCSFAQESCFKENQELREVKSGHFISCCR